MDELRPPKHVNYIDGFAYIRKAGEGLLSESLVDGRIHRQNLVAGLLQVSSHAVTCPPGVIGQPDHGDCSGLV